MKKQSAKWTNKQSLALWAALLLGLGFYWGPLLRASLNEQYGSDPQELAGFVRWLLGYVLLFLGFMAAGWLNHRGPFAWWAAARERAWGYYAWLLLLWWGLFELLQGRSQHDIELAVENWLAALLGMALIAGFTLVLDRIKAKREHLELQQQKTAAELDNLRAQLHPHFLFNALNTIYSEALQQGQEGLSERIGELSSVLRFALNQARRQNVGIQEELDFLQRYANLQLARLPSETRQSILLEFDWDEQPAQLAPLLIVPFLENAFQYGLHPDKPCFLRLRLQAQAGWLEMDLENSIIRPAKRSGNGLGIANVRQRLERLYPKKHQLSIASGAQVFSVHLRLPLEPLNSTRP